MTKEKKTSKQIDEKQKSEEVKISHFQDSIKANIELKDVLKLALKQTSTTIREVLPKLSIATAKYIHEFKDNLKDKTVTDDMMKLLSKKQLTTHCYSLVGYNRKNEVNDLFEKLVSRAIRLAIMCVDFPDEFSVDAETNEVFIMSKILEPKIPVKIKGSKITKLQINKDESLEPVTTYAVDQVFKRKYPTGTRKTTTKDETADEIFKNITIDFLKGFEKLIAYSSKHNVKFFDMIDESTFEKLETIRYLLNSQDYIDVKTFSVEYQPDFNGNLERTKVKQVSK